MTANVDIKRGDLRLAVSAALNRGRYVLTTAGGDGQPVEITIDLRERPDDLFEAETEAPPRQPRTVDELVVKLSLDVSEFESSLEAMRAKHPEAFPSDDHGASIPAQGEFIREPIPTGKDAGFQTFDAGPTLYEITLQTLARSARKEGIEITLENVTLADVLKWGDGMNRADRCDWVHVYDRVTRERRTLKRPAADAVLTGLRDVAADLRGKIPMPWGKATGQAAGTIDYSRGAPVDPPFGCAALPPVGPLTSTEGLKPGDVLRVTDESLHWSYGLVSVCSPDGSPLWPIHARSLVGNVNAQFKVSEVAFVGRPDADGWMAWAGGENPVPGATVHVIFRDGQHLTAESEILEPFWTTTAPNEAIDRFRIIDAAKGKEDAS